MSISTGNAKFAPSQLILTSESEKSEFSQFGAVEKMKIGVCDPHHLLHVTLRTISRRAKLTWIASPELVQALCMHFDHLTCISGVSQSEA